MDGTDTFSTPEGCASPCKCIGASTGSWNLMVTIRCFTHCFFTSVTFDLLLKARPEFQ